MALADLDEYFQAINSPYQRINFRHTQDGSAPSGKLCSLWTFMADPNGVGVAPTTAVVPASSIAGALNQRNGDLMRIIQLQAESANLIASQRRESRMLVIADRLGHTGGLSGVTTTAQTTNLPTAALTRYTTGVGVMAALEIYSQLGTTATTCTVEYTDNDGNTGQVSPTFPIGGGTGAALDCKVQGRMLTVPLLAGDKGVRAVANVDLLATTGTAGNFGVTLFKPLFFVPMIRGMTIVSDPLLSLGACGMEEVLDDACLMLIAACDDRDNNSMQIAMGEILFSED